MQILLQLSIFGLEDEQEKQDSGTLSGPPLVSQLSTSTSSGPLVVGNLCEEQQPLGAVLHLGRKSSRNQSNIKEQEDDDFTDDDFTRREPTLQLVQQLGKHTDVDGADGEDDDGTFSSNINDSTTLVMHTNAASTTTKKGSSGKIFTSKTVLGGRPFTTTSPSSDNLSLYSSTSSSTTSSKFERILTILRNAWQEGSIVENLPRTVTALANVDPRLVILRVIFTKTYLAVMSGHFSHTFMAFMLMAWLPTFFGKDNAFYTGFPFLISMIASPLWPEYARRQLEAKKPLLGVRKQVGFVGIFTPAIGLLLALACGDDLPILKTLCFTLTIASGAAAGSSVTAAPLDLAGREHAGALFACSNAVAAIPGILGVRLGKNMAVGVLVCALYKIFAAAVYVRYVSVDRII
ncbi:unnamed protein product [Amoebophrya sp. A25]|nr:unnamed protein product [Amoebophrya sp. A25]|eukprot:GSA25T00009015001.1